MLKRTIIISGITFFVLTFIVYNAKRSAVKCIGQRVNLVDTVSLQKILVVNNKNNIVLNNNLSNEWNYAKDSMLTICPVKTLVYLKGKDKYFKKSTRRIICFYKNGKSDTITLGNKTKFGNLFVKSCSKKEYYIVGNGIEKYFNDLFKQEATE